MKANVLVVLVVSTLLATSCSKNSTNNSSVESKTDESLVVNNEPEITLSSKQIINLSEETDLNKRRQMLLKSMSENIGSKNTTTIINLYKNKKISTDEFRSLFWASKISKDMIKVLKSNSLDISTLSDLDRTLLMSIEDNITFDELLTEIKKETNEIPVSMQSVLTNEILKNYIKDFDSINNDETTLYEKLSPINNPSTDLFLVKLHKLMKLTFYKKRLESKRLVAPKNTNGSTSNRAITSNFSLNYFYRIGRCGQFQNQLNFTTLTQDFGMQCPTETPSVANLHLYNKVGEMFGETIIHTMINSGVIGGYDKGHKEDATTNLNYQLTGKVVIPKCLNPAYCQQIVTISVMDLGAAYSGSTLTNDSVSITVNGNPFSNTNLNYVSVDISKNDAIIDINISGNKNHVGACCNNPNTYQKINLTITSGIRDITPVRIDEIRSLYTFNKPAFMGGYKYSFGSSANFNTPSLQVLALKSEISASLANKATLDNYRDNFYAALELRRMHLDALMKNDGKPLEILNDNQLISAISDSIGRDLILPIIQSKLISYQNTNILNVQKNINEMFKTILLTNLNASNATEEIAEIIKDKMPEMNADSVDLASKFVKGLEENKTGQKELLDQISAFQTEFAFTSKSVLLEMELLNLEQAQFIELPISNKGIN